VTSRLNPYLSFPGSARQALEFYEQVLGGTLTLNTFGDLGAQHGQNGDQIMHGLLETDLGFTLMASDYPPGMDAVHGNDFAVSLSGDDDALRGYWEQLCAGGQVQVPLEKQMWGDEFGMCTDQFGVQWMVNIGAPRT
jgi:PhnB protein